MNFRFGREPEGCRHHPDGLEFGLSSRSRFEAAHTGQGEDPLLVCRTAVLNQNLSSRVAAFLFRHQTEIDKLMYSLVQTPMLLNPLDGASL